MKDSFERATVGEIVANDFRTANIFEQLGIDFCCGGRQSLAEACRTAGIDSEHVRRAVDGLAPVAADQDDDVTLWPLDRLMDHILESHHAYVRAALPMITDHLAKLVHVHGARHPELLHTKAAFEAIGRELLQHMMKEERALFPYIRELATRDGASSAPSPFGTVENPIRMMEREHRQAADEMRLVRELTHGYVPPPDGCSTYRMTFDELARFERDLHRHVHLENNVLFPKAVELEDQVCGG
jgi:regulator of cell morphogenesis and NO signaling